MNETSWSYFNNNYPNLILLAKADDVKDREFFVFRHLTNLLGTTISLDKDDKDSNDFKYNYKQLYFELSIKNIKIKKKTKKLIKHYANQIFDDCIPFFDLFLMDKKQLNNIPELCSLYTPMLYNIDKELDHIIEEECRFILNKHQNNTIGFYCKKNNSFEFNVISHIKPNSQNAYIYKDETDVIYIYSENRETSIKLGEYIVDNKDMFSTFLDFDLMDSSIDSLSIIDMVHHYDKKDIELLYLNYFDTFCDTDLVLKKQNFISLSTLIEEIEHVLHNNIELNIKVDYIRRMTLIKEGKIKIGS